jgi:hypothetical protein
VGSCNSIEKIYKVNGEALAAAKEKYNDIASTPTLTASLREADIVKRRIDVQEYALNTEAFSRACSFAK